MNAFSIYDDIIKLYISKKAELKDIKEFIVEKLVCTKWTPFEFLKFKVIIDRNFFRDIEEDSLDTTLEGIYNFHIKNDPILNEQFKSNLTTYSDQFLKNNDKIFHILTDIDDTLYPHFNHTGLAGTDISWKTKEAYPGIKKLYHVLYSNCNLFP
ncbi:unnamed protein product, partial [marine sediment metagenome]